jgi:pimeloyl-ACP methyl ester carboxylesterase
VRTYIKEIQGEIMPIITVSGINFYYEESGKGICHETLVLVGEDDILITPCESKVLEDNIPNSSTVIISDAGHTPHVENKKEFSTRILEFLS